jgi:hypothetical protein
MTQPDKTEAQRVAEEIAAVCFPLDTRLQETLRKALAANIERALIAYGNALWKLLAEHAVEDIEKNGCTAHRCKICGGESEYDMWEGPLHHTDECALKEKTSP